MTLSKSMDGIDNVVRALRDTMFDHGHANVELEFRLGRVVNGAFVAGVSKATFDTLFDILHRSPAFARSDITTLEKLNGTDARFVITNGDDASGQWCYKKKVYCHTEPTHRISVALEGHDHSPPPSGSPPLQYHRLKKRTSFRHECWSIDMTRVTSNLPGHFDNDEEIYEVELELVGVEAYFVYTLDHLVAWGSHLLREIDTLLKSSCQACS